MKARFLTKSLLSGFIACIVPLELGRQSPDLGDLRQYAVHVLVEGLLRPHGLQRARNTKDMSRTPHSSYCKITLAWCLRSSHSCGARPGFLPQRIPESTFNLRTIKIFHAIVLQGAHAHARPSNKTFRPCRISREVLLNLLLGERFVPALLHAASLPHFNVVLSLSTISVVPASQEHKPA